MRLHEKLLALNGKNSVRSLASRAGLPVSTVQGAVNGDNIPRLDAALRLANALGVSLEWLADDDQGMPPPNTDVGAEVEILLANQDERLFAEYLFQVNRCGSPAVVLAAGLEMLLNAMCNTQFVNVNFEGVDGNAAVAISEAISTSLSSEADNYIISSMRLRHDLATKENVKSPPDLEARKAEYLQKAIAGTIRAHKSPGTKPRKKAAKKRGQDESRGGESKP